MFTEGGIPPLTFLRTISQCQVAELEVMHLTSIQYTPPSVQTWKRSHMTVELGGAHVAECTLHINAGGGDPQ